MSLRGQSISLRRKLAGLLAAFAAFAVVAAAATIYGIQWHVEGAAREFERTLGRTIQINHLNVALTKQMLSLREVLEGRTDAVDPYFESREEFFTRLRQVAAFAPSEAAGLRWKDILQLAQRLADESDQCLTLQRTSKTDEAKNLLATSLNGELLPELEAKFRDAKAILDRSRNQATRELDATSLRVLFLTIAVGAFAAGLVIIGVTLIRRWLIVPIAELQEATRRFSQGNLSYRVTPRYDDELGRLGMALNEMAGSLATARTKLQASETKHRRLFTNLCDAVVICDVKGEIVEYHDSDSRLLGVEGAEHIGRYFLDVWPTWIAVGGDWSSIIGAAVAEGRRYRAVDVELKTGESTGGWATADFLVYRIEYGGARYAAIVVRDVTERQRLQRKLRQAETMEAVGTLAGGLAHDFNNLLAGVIGSLSLLATEVTDSQHAERIRSVIRNCWQAAGLSRRLLNFASSAHGEPQVFCLREAVTVITNSLDPSFLEGIEVQRVLESPVSVRMDRDQLTQIVLNLLRNARDAMPDGGTLRIQVGSTVTRDPEGGRVEGPYAVLAVQDTGVGMTREVQSRIFEPFFTTKSRASRRGRGMGMAIAYSAVRNARGFVQVESKPGCGTTFCVYLPICESVSGEHVSAPHSPLTQTDKGVILFVEEDAVIRDVGTTALQRWGYSVLAADGAEDARSKLAAVGSGAVALAVIDMSLSAGDSLNLAEHVLALNANSSILFTTALTEQPLPSHLEPHVRAQLLKPFRLEALATAVSAALTPSLPHH